MRRRLLFVAAAVAVALTVTVNWQLSPTKAEPQAQPANRAAKVPNSSLPLNQVILFSSGVGYFQREGEVEDDARVDLQFGAGDINDLLKSMVLQDLNGGKITLISYDSHDPVEKTLKSFALDLTANPTFGQVLNQARGEKIEVTLQQAAAIQPNPITGAIVGMETLMQPAGKDPIEVHQLNLLCADGMRSVLLSQVQRVRFLNPVLENELKRALDVLASSHDAQKKTVSLSFSGTGKRTVRVGYVVENPIWKTSYRLVLDQKGKPLLQGWAVVENTSDEDWNKVRTILISGRPISFQMDLYQPLYIPRPRVEPELFASLRPPAYSGALTGRPGEVDPNAGVGVPQMGQNLGGLLPGQGFGVIGGLPPGQGLGMAGRGNPYQGSQGGMQMGMQGGQMGGNQMGNFPDNPLNYRLTYDELQKRRQQLLENKENAKHVGSKLADPTAGVASVASAEEIGDYFQYTIDHPVSLPRQKSALLPIVSKNVEAAKVSIFNETVHAKFPLLGLRFKNATGQNLMQGPMTVYEGAAYAGDARIMDLQPGEERLLSYAIDLGTEVKAENKGAPEQLTSVKIVKGILQATHKLRDTKTYLMKNRSEHDRTVLIEHPVRTDWKLIEPAKPLERSREVYRFEVEVPAGKTARQVVIEEQMRLSQVAILGAEDRSIRIFFNSTISSSKVKEALKEALGFRSRLAETQQGLAHLEQQLKGITEDQNRLRENLRTVPADSAAHKRYLEKFDTQETKIEKFQAEIEQLRETEKKQKKEYEDYLAGLNVE